MAVSIGRGGHDVAVESGPFPVQTADAVALALRHHFVCEVEKFHFVFT